MKVSDLLESRARGVVYTEKQVGGEVQKVIAELSGQNSAAWTRLASDYAQLDSSIKELELQRGTLNAEIKGKAESLFNARDAALTRVIETAQLTITLSKKVKKPSVEKVDAEAVLQALINANLVPELRKVVKSIIKAHTSMTEPSESPERLSVKRNFEESVTQISAFLSRLVERINGILRLFDRKFLKLKRDVAAL